MPERLVVLCSGNIVKNVKSVIVPGTGGLRGIEAAALIGAVGGDAGAGLNVLHGVTDAHRAETAALLDSGACSVGLLESEEPLHIRLSAKGGAHRAKVEIRGSHTNIVGRRLDGRGAGSRRRGRAAVRRWAGLEWEGDESGLRRGHGPFLGAGAA